MSKEENILRVYADMISGLDDIAKDTIMSLTLLNDGRLEIKPRFFGKETIHLPYNQITNVGKLTAKEIIERDRSVIGRAIVGDLFFGPLGAIVGGMSAIGKKKVKTNYKLCLVINYLSGESSEPKVLSFNLVSRNWPGQMKKFINSLRERANLPEPEATLKQKTPSTRTL